jgi:hypothetical protein
MHYFYVTTFCQQPHRLRDGRPMGHSCYVLDHDKLRTESEGRRVEGSMIRQPERVVKGRALSQDEAWVLGQLKAARARQR